VAGFGRLAELGEAEGEAQTGLRSRPGVARVAEREAERLAERRLRGLGIVVGEESAACDQAEDEVGLVVVLAVDLGGAGEQSEGLVEAALAGAHPRRHAAVVGALGEVEGRGVEIIEGREEDRLGLAAVAA
jgi:hypothetical protein